MSQFTPFCGNIWAKKAAAQKSKDFWDSASTHIPLKPPGSIPQPPETFLDKHCHCHFLAVCRTVGNHKLGSYWLSKNSYVNWLSLT